MEKNLLKSVRVRVGMTQGEVASLLEKSTDAYAKKERGETFFSPAEMVILTKAFNLTFSEFNDIFFSSKLQFGKDEGGNQSSLTV